MADSQDPQLPGSTPRPPQAPTPPNEPAESASSSWRDNALAQLKAWGARLKVPSKWEPSVLLEKAAQVVQKQGGNFYVTAGTIVLSTYFAADIVALGLGSFIPTTPLFAPSGVGMSPGFYSPPGEGLGRPRAPEDYAAIFGRNLFNSEGKIPGEEAPQEGPIQDQGGAPVRTSLPIQLIGTLVLSNELKSIATIEDKSASLVFPVRMEDEIPGKLRVLAVEPRRVIFVNLSSGRREFSELPEDSTTAPRINLGAPTASTGGIEQVSANRFNISARRSG